VPFFNRILFGTPQLFQFIGRRQTLRAPEKGHNAFHSEAIAVEFPSQTSDYDVLSVEIICCQNGSFHPQAGLHLVCLPSPRRRDDVENTPSLNFLHPFAAVKNLCLVCGKIVPCIAPALQELVGATTTGVLPTVMLDIFLEVPGPLRECKERFVTAGQLTRSPVIL
jgi:hypothetical protein